MVLTSAGVEVTVTDNSVYAQASPTTIPLVVLATRSKKPTPDGTGTARGTIEAGKLRLVTSQRELKQNYGNPVFVTSGGDPVHGDESNEYGLLALHSFLGQGNRAYVVRADIDLGQLVPTTVEPTLPPADGVFWIETDQVVGGIMTYNSGTWTPVPFHVYTTVPGNSDGANGDWCFDYSTTNGTLKAKVSGAWVVATQANVTGSLGASNPLHIGATAPSSPSNGDFWYKTVAGAGGANLKLSKFRASDGKWIEQSVVRQTAVPTPTQGLVWEDLSTLATNGFRPIRVGTGSAFVLIDLFAQEDAPVADPAPGTLWFDDTMTDFALYREANNKWVKVATTTTSNPSGTQKYISGSAPSFPSVDAIWVDTSTEVNLDNFPVIKRWDGSVWVDITDTVKVTDEALDPTLQIDGTYWLNTGESITKNIVKSYDPTYTAYTVDATSGLAEAEDLNFWKPVSGKAFGRKAQRKLVVEAMQAAFVSNDDIRAESVYFQLIAAPGYPELYDEMVALNTDNKEISFIVADTPKFMVPSGIPTGREVTASEWMTNVNNVEQTNEEGFSGAPTPYAAFYYPWGLATNTDGLNVMVPPSHMALRAIAYSDSVSAPWFPPAGYARGRVDNAGSVGFLTNEGEYLPVALSRTQRDVLQEQKINPISNIPNRGLTIFGQKTMLATAKAMDRINVSRLVAKMKYDLQRLLEPFLFEINDAVTRRSAQVVVDRYLAGLKSLRGLYDYASRCDESNNTADRVDRNELWVDVAIKPAKAIEFIYIPISVVGTGDQLQ